MKDRLLADLDARIARHANGDSSGVLDAQALALVTQLATLGDPDAGSLTRVAALHLCRYEALPPEHGELDLQLALAIYTNLHTVDPRLVPPEVRDFLGLASPHDTGIALMGEYERTGRTDHLERAISLFRQEMLAWQPDPANGLYSLAMALLRRYERFGRPADLHESIELGRDAVAAAAPHDPRRAGFRSGLAIGLLRRFELTFDVSDVDEAVAIGREVVAATTGDPSHAMDLSNLAAALTRRFEHTGHLADLDAAVGAGRRAAADTSHPDHAMHLANLVGALVRRFELTGMPGDLDEAVDAGRRAITVTPPDHPNLASCQATLGMARSARYEREGRLAELDEAIELGRAALAATPTGHPMRARRATLVGATLLRRFERTGQLSDLDDAVDLSRAAAAAVPADHPSRPGFLAALAGTLVRRFERTGRLSDLDEAITLGRSAIADLPDGHPQGGSLASTVGLAQRARFEHTGDLSDLDDAVTLSRAAVAAVSDGHIDRGTVLSNLARALRSRFEHAGRPADLAEAVDAARAAVAITPADHPDRARHLDDLGYLLQLTFARTGQRSHLDEAIAAGRAAAGAEQSPLAARVHAAVRRWSGLAAAHGEHDEALAGLAAAVDLLPALAWHGLDRPTREYQLAEWPGLASEAAAFAVAVQRPQRAVELLEHGRSVLWASILHTRTDLSRLAEVEPATAARLAGIRALLDHATPADRLVIAPEYAAGTRPADRARLAAEWDDAVDHVRRLPGFEHFLAPTPFAELGRAADEGPVAIVNVAHARCDALIIRSALDGPRVDAVPLPNLTVASAIDRTNELITALNRAARPDAGFLDRERARHTTHDVLAWLWDVVAAPIMDALRPNTRRMWWCPTGPLTLLPLHAAGHYPRTATADTAATATCAVPEHVISSYTTTLSALLGPRQRGPRPPGALLAIGMPDTPAVPQPLPAVPAELAAVGLRFPPDRVRQLVGPEATRDAVLRGLRDHSWTHWSCHGAQNLADPASGAVFLWDGPLTVLDIAGQRLDEAELAYLSACQTAVGGAALVDEAIHLAAAFQLAGYRHVIATLWPIRDQHAPTVADTVYRTLTATGQPDADTAAEALHTAIAQLRADHPTDPTVWAAYTHNGP